MLAIDGCQGKLNGKRTVGTIDVAIARLESDLDGVGDFSRLALPGSLVKRMRCAVFFLCKASCTLTQTDGRNGEAIVELDLGKEM